MTPALLEVENLSVDYVVGAGSFHALQSVSFSMREGEVLGIVGETGCGKSTLAHSIPRLLPEPPARVRSGTVRFRGADLLAVPKWKLPALRGTSIGMIFQEPINSLNPAFRVFDQLAEAIRIRRLREAGRLPAFRDTAQGFDYSSRPLAPVSDVLSGPFVPGAARAGRAPARPASAELRQEALEYLRLVRINDPETILGLYPHELSGGMRQRVMIAMALSEKPSLLIADEPTSALDVTIQAQVLTLMKELMQEVKTSILFISHDLGIIAEMADELGVMYAGHLVEVGPVAEVFDAPRHPYTRSLLRSIPHQYKQDGPIPALPGSVPNLSQLPAGCPFHPRCALARAKCASDPGPTLDAWRSSGTHRSACWYAPETAAMT
ncbi:MAG TPA: ABC transporter ATP-binding protein [Thermoplasmata archaeon]|nr:ABC transporter ATP-binding protein [Thermoplasmata archaeon]